MQKTEKDWAVGLAAPLGHLQAEVLLVQLAQPPRSPTGRVWLQAPGKPPIQVGCDCQGGRPSVSPKGKHLNASTKFISLGVS